jgi:hypothetical protein
LKGLYDAKLHKYAKALAGKTAAMERLHSLDSILDPLSNIAGNSIVHSRGSDYINSNRHTYDPIASHIGRTASSRNNSTWYLDLFDQGVE